MQSSGDTGGEGGGRQRNGGGGKSHSGGAHRHHHHQSSRSQRLHRYAVMDYATARSYKRPSFQTPFSRFLLLAFIGLWAFIVAWGVDSSIQQMYILRSRVASDVGGWTVILFNLVMCTLAVLLVHHGTPYVAGSGIPEMKSTMSGIHIHRFLAKRTLVAKALALVCVHAASLSVGREGPFVHMACIVANALMSLQVFRKFKDNGPRQLAVLAAACATGVAATFGSVVGGLLFSIEVTATYYLVGHIPQSLFCCVVGSFLVHGIRGGDATLLFHFDNTSLANHSLLAVRDMAIFALVGVVCGFVGVGFHHALRFGLRLRHHFVGPRLWRRIAAVMCVSSITSVVVIAGDYNPDATGVWETLAHLFSLSQHELVEYTVGAGDLSSSSDYALLIFAPIKLLLSIAALCMPVPAGMFTPVFAAGAVFGRAIGGGLTLWLPPDVFPYAAAEVAAVAGAALASGVTCTISSAVVVMELTGQLHLQLPTMVACLAAYVIGKRVGGESIYDLLISINRLPFLPPLKLSTGLDPVVQSGPHDDDDDSFGIPKPVQIEYTPPVAPRSSRHAAARMTVEEVVTAMSIVSTAHHSSRHSRTKLRPIVLDDTDLPVVASTDMRSPDYYRLVGSVRARDVVAVVEAAGLVDAEAIVQFVADYEDPDALLHDPGSTKAVLQELERSHDTSSSSSSSSSSEASSDDEEGAGRSKSTPHGVGGESTDKNSATASTRLLGQATYGAVSSPRAGAVVAHSPSRGEEKRRRSSAMLATNLTSARVRVSSTAAAALARRTSIPEGTAAAVQEASAADTLVSTDVVGRVAMDSSPLQVPLWTPLSKVDLFFRMLRLGVCYITHQGRLVGAITRHSLMASPYYAHG